MFTRTEKQILALMSAVQFCLIVDFMMVMPLGPQLMRLFEISARQFGSLVSAYTLGAGLMGVLASFYLDRFDRKRALLVFLSGFALGNLACAASSSYGMLLGARFVTGVFGGVVGSILYSIVSDSIDIDRRASALGIVMSSFALASILGVPICLVFSNKLGWHAPFAALALCSLGVAAGVAVWLPAITHHLGEAKENVPTRFLDLIANKNRAFALVFMAFLILGNFTVNPFLFPSIVSNAGISENRLPIVYLIGGLGSIIATVSFGKMSDRFGKKRIFVIAALLSLIAIFTVTRLGRSSLFEVSVAVTAFFVFMGGRLTPAMTLVTATCVPKNRGGFLSLVGSVQQISAALAAFISGLIVTKAEDGKLYHFEQVGLLAIAFSIVALLLCRGITPIEGEES